MAEFINTVDLIGDEALTDGILDGSVTEYKDNIVTKIGSRAFSFCNALRYVNCPNATTVETEGFRECSSLEIADFASLTSVGDCAFLLCSNLKALVLRSSVMCTTYSGNDLNNTPIKEGAGYIYVPSALVDSYKSATNWSNHSSKFRALEDYTVDGTTTGELDPTKI